MMPEERHPNCVWFPHAPTQTHTHEHTQRQLGHEFLNLFVCALALTAFWVRKKAVWATA